MCKTLLRFIVLFIFICRGADVNAQCPSTQITSTKSAFCISEYVELNATNIPSNSTVEWNLGSGWDTATSNYKGSATAVGQLNASVRVTLNTGEVCNYLAFNLTKINPLPEPAYSISKNLLCEGIDTVTLWDNTVNSFKRSWLLNSSNYTNTASQMQIKVPATGIFSITLIADDTNGCRNVTTWNNALKVYNNIAPDFTKSSNKACYPVTTDLTSTFNLGGQTIKSYEWQIPGALVNTSTSKDVKNAYFANIGVFSPKLSIETNQGCSYIVVKNNYITVGDSVQLGTSIDKATACLSEPVTITQTTASLPGIFSWDINSSSRKFNSKYQGVFTFRDTGYYNLVLTYNHNNCISTLTKNNIVRIKGLKADFISNNAFHCEAPHIVNLVNTSDTISSTISSYLWRIIDATSGNLLTSSTNKNFNPTITSQPSAYNVELVINSSSGCSDTAKKAKFIEIKPYQFDFYAEPKIGCVGQSVTYTNKTKSASYYGLDLYSWDFFAPNKTTKLGSSASLSPVFIYNDTGHYHTQLTAANPLGCQQIKMLDNAVWIVNPSLNVLVSDTAVCSSESVQFIGNSTPKDENFTHNYVLVNKASGKKYSYTGDAVDIKLNEIGEYDLKYNYDITGACNDTLVRKFYVNGIKGSIKLDTLSACSPIEVTPTFIPEYNFHIGETDTTLRYNWEVVPKAGALISGAGTPNPKITLTQDRTYRIVLYVTNSTGCGYYISSSPIVTGINAGINLSRDSACIGDTIQVLNTSTNNPSAISWKVLNTEAFSFDSITKDLRTFIALDKGEFNIQLIATKSNVCSDTITKTVYISNVSADFELVNTNLGCAPVTVLFKNNSTLADNLMWDLGDGSTKETLNIDTLKYTYTNNSGSNGFSVRLIAFSNFGCTDTLLKPNLLNLQGPVAKFDILTPTGCEPAKPNIINQSTNYKNFYFDYGNGIIDTNKIVNPEYWNSTSLISQSYTLKITMEDEFGCKASFVSPKKVIAYAYPEINLVVNPDTVLCQRQKINIQDTGIFATKWNWTLDGTSISTDQNYIYQVTKSGFNTLKLISSNAYGCKATATKDLQVLESADLDFTYPPFLCVDAPATIQITTDGISPSLYNWNFGESGTPNNEQITTEANATISYRKPGNKKIIVNAEMPNGCSVPDSTTINVFDSNKIPVIELASAGYDSLNHIVIQYPNFNFSYFDFFNVYRDDIFLRQEAINAEKTIIDSTYDTTSRHCYNISINDKCGVEGKRGRAHCPIQLIGKSTVPRQVVLDWTYYVGWANVEKYEIYRKEIDSSFKFVGEVFSTQKTHIDSNNVCSKPYYYKVAAKYPGTEVRAFSNWIFVNPQVDYNPNKPVLNNVSVVGFNEIEVKWSPSTYRYTTHYLITRAEEKATNIVDSFFTPLTRFIDTLVNPHLYHYFYKVHDVDNCLNISEPGRYSKTIFLEGSNKSGESEIIWTPYEHWDYPTTEHHVELLPLNGRKYLGKVEPSVFSYKDNGFYEDVDGYYRYQVYSINSNLDTSYSNVAYISGAGIYYIPNSFTPNNDGLNDEFSFYTLFITNNKQGNETDFEIEIYNRWGQSVYYSNDISKNWDGTYLDKPAPAGVYQYRMKLIDGDRNKTNLGGTIHLLR